MLDQLTGLVSGLLAFLPFGAIGLVIPMLVLYLVGIWLKWSNLSLFGFLLLAFILLLFVVYVDPNRLQPGICVESDGQTGAVNITIALEERATGPNTIRPLATGTTTAGQPLKTNRTISDLAGDNNGDNGDMRLIAMWKCE